MKYHDELTGITYDVDTKVYSPDDTHVCVEYIVNRYINSYELYLKINPDGTLTSYEP